MDHAWPGRRASDRRACPCRAQVAAALQAMVEDRCRSCWFPLQSATFPGVALLDGAFGLLRLAGGEGLDGIGIGLRIINIERLDVALVHFDVVSVVLLGPALFAWMAAKWRQAPNPNPDIDRIERALAKLVKSCREIRAEFEEQAAERVG